MQGLKFHLTQSLLSSWLWSYRTDDGYARFVEALNRHREPPSPEMLDGIQFENCVNNYLNGAPLVEGHKWYRGITATADYLWGAQQQVSLYRDLIVDGVCFSLNGVLDFLRAGVIYDTKFSKTYHLNKYLDSPQHAAYFYLVPEATEFQYLSCDGSYVYREIYHPEDVRPIEKTVRDFMVFLDRTGLIDTYTSLWELNSYYSYKKEK